MKQAPPKPISDLWMPLDEFLQLCGFSKQHMHQRYWSRGDGPTRVYIPRAGRDGPPRVAVIRAEAMRFVAQLKIERFMRAERAKARKPKTVRAKKTPARKPGL